MDDASDEETVYLQSLEGHTGQPHDDYIDENQSRVSNI